jgi:hypothetical protein
MHGQQQMSALAGAAAALACTLQFPFTLVQFPLNQNLQQQLQRKEQQQERL